MEKGNQYLTLADDNRRRYLYVLQSLLDRQQNRWLSALLERIHPAEIENWWGDFTREEQDRIVSLLPQENLALLVAELHENDRDELFQRHSNAWIIALMEELDSDDVVSILRGMSNWQANNIITHLDKSDAMKIKSLLKYPPETAGGLMSLDFLAVQQEADIESIITQFRRVVEVEEIEDIHFIYVIDKQNRLQGYIPLRKLILKKGGHLAKDLMLPPIVSILPSLDQEEVVATFRTHDLISVPVVDEKGTLLGRITIDDVVDVLDDEVSEDVFQMVGLGKNEHLSNDILTSMRNRVPWMLINLGTSVLAAAIIGLFQATLQKLVVLAMFMPMVAALGGATANQMVALIVRGLAMGELHWSSVRWIFFRELASVIFGSLLIGVLAGGFAYQTYHSFALGTIVALALLLNLIFATTVGTGIPLLLRLLKLDPAMGSSIIVSALTDMMGFFIFLSLANQFLL